MEEMKKDPRLFMIAEKIKNEVWLQTQELAKGSVKMDHADVQGMVQTAMIILALKELRDELYLLNNERRAKSFFYSMLNPGID